MPVEIKPLFRPDVLRRRLEAFDLPDHVDRFRGKLAKWADLFASGRGDRLKEKPRWWDGADGPRLHG